MSITRSELTNYLDKVLEPEQFKDYAPNGLQVEGADKIQRILTGVTASQVLLDEAVAWQADAVLVHHGYFWKGESVAVIGLKQRRLKTLLTHNINLLAYHLPLDAHPLLGNNVQLAERLGIVVKGGLEPNNPRSIGLVGNFSEPISLEELGKRVEINLERSPCLVAGGNHLIKRIGLCTGGAQGYIEQAADLGLDAYISGEISEQTTHSARENKLHYIAAGHHATERYGIQALTEAINNNLAVEAKYIEIDNPA